VRLNFKLEQLAGIEVGLEEEEADSERIIHEFRREERYRHNKGG
jgi:hypothetical protein